MLERPRDDAKGYDVMFVDAASQVGIFVVYLFMLALEWACLWYVC